MPKASSKAARATRGSPRKNTTELRCLQCPDLPLRKECPHSPEGREFLALAAVPKVARAPQRCTKCPDRPLRSQCEHTQTGREYLRQRDIETTLTLTLRTDAHDETPAQPQTLGTDTTLPCPVIGPPSDSLTPPDPLHSPAAHNLAEPGNTEIACDPSTPQVGSIPIDPLLLTPRPVTISHGANVNPFTPQSLFSMESTEPSTPASSLSSLPSILQTRKKYIRPTKGNPRFGYVKGAMRGTREFDVLRRHTLPSPSKDSVAASKDFLEGMHRVLEKAEDVAMKTGCWLFVGAQHPGAASGTIHYTSLRLVRDAPEDAEALVNDYNTLMSSLLRSRRSDALDACKQLEEAQQQNARLESEVCALKDVIKEYSTRLGVAE